MDARAKFTLDPSHSVYIAIRQFQYVKRCVGFGWHIVVYRCISIEFNKHSHTAPLRTAHSELWNQSRCDHFKIVSCYRTRSPHLFMFCVSITFSCSEWVPVTRNPLNSEALCIHTPRIHTHGSVRFSSFHLFDCIFVCVLFWFGFFLFYFDGVLFLLMSSSSSMMMF